ncbi:T9SS type A sorting domain-containing protein [Psychroserpens sp. MEBiC05023]
MKKSYSNLILLVIILAFFAKISTAQGVYVTKRIFGTPHSHFIEEFNTSDGSILDSYNYTTSFTDPYSPRSLSYDSSNKTIFGIIEGDKVVKYNAETNAESILNLNIASGDSYEDIIAINGRLFGIKDYESSTVPLAKTIEEFDTSIGNILNAFPLDSDLMYYSKITHLSFSNTTNEITAFAIHNNGNRLLVKFNIDTGMSSTFIIPILPASKSYEDVITSGNFVYVLVNDFTNTPSVNYLEKYDINTGNLIETINYSTDLSGYDKIENLTFSTDESIVYGMVQNLTDNSFGVISLDVFLDNEALISLPSLGVSGDYDEIVFTGEVNTPTIQISQPLANADVSNYSFDVVFSVENFDVAEAIGESGDGYIKIYQDGVHLGDRYSTIFQFSLGGWTVGPHTLTLELVDLGGNSLTPAVTSSVDVNVMPTTSVSNISQLRAQTLGQFYVLTNEAVVTYNRNIRNERYIQDLTAGILIDDPNGIIIDPILPGFGLTNLVGQLTEFHGVLQFVPSSNAIVTSTGNSYNTADVTYNEVLINWENHESEVVTLENGFFVGTTPGELFVAGTNYTISDGVTNLTFRTLFSDADYIGTPIPISFDQITKLIVSEYDGTPQVTAIELSDFVNPTLSNQGFYNNVFNVYPNPVSTDLINISSQNGLTVNVEVYDVLGRKKIVANTIENKLDISSLKPGLYILNLSQGYKFVSKKIIKN